MKIRAGGGKGMKQSSAWLRYGVVLAASNVMGCDAFNKIKDALDGEPQTSYCEALCDWAVSCAEGESALSPDEMMAEHPISHACSICANMI